MFRNLLIAASLLLLPLFAVTPVSAEELSVAIPDRVLRELSSAAEKFRASGLADEVKFAISIPGGSREISLIPHEIRSQRLIELEEASTSGVRVDLFKGKAEGAETYSRFSLLAEEGKKLKLQGFLKIDGLEYVLESGLPKGQVEYYRLRKTIDEISCGVEEHSNSRAPRTSRRLSRSLLSSLSRTTRVIELATEADFDYVQVFGGVAQANANILNVVNGADAILQNQLGVRLQVVFQHGWDTADPYREGGSVTISDFANYWNTNFSGSVVYDIAHLWTAKKINAGGRAFVGTVCENLRYSISANLTPANRSKTLAHELGHNLGATHDTPSECPDENGANLNWVMCSNPFFDATQFSPVSKSDIANRLTTASCLAAEEGQNEAPTLNNPGTQSINEGELLSLQLSASDPDGDSLSFSAVSVLPPGASFSSGGRLSWKPAGDQSGAVSFTIKVQDPGGLSDTDTFNIIVSNNSSIPPLPARHAIGDFDGDGKAELSVFRNPSGMWFSTKADNSDSLSSIQFGLPGDVPVVGDFNGDRISDRVVYRQSTSTWFIRNSGTEHVSSAQFGLFGDIPAAGDYDGDGRDDIAVFRPSSGLFIYRPASGGGDVVQALGLKGDIPVPCDYDGDGRDEVAFYRIATGSWVIVNGGNITSTQFGLPADVPLPADYDGDGSCDLAVFRPSDGNWFVKDQATVQFGLPGDVPEPADVDGDGKTELAVFRDSTGVHFYRGIENGSSTSSKQFGLPGDLLPGREANLYASRFTFGDTRLVRNGVSNQLSLVRPRSDLLFTATLFGAFASNIPSAAGQYVLHGDYDGDGLKDTAVFSSGLWILYFANGQVLAVGWGVAGDIPVTGDFDFDGKSDLAVYRPDSGAGFSQWFILQSGNGAPTVYSFGLPGDVPIPADYNADGLSDIALFRPSTGTWFVRDQRSGAIIDIQQWGLFGDLPRVADFDNDGRVDKIAFRPANGVWYVATSGKQQLAVQWGVFGDIPVPGFFSNTLFADYAVYRASTATLFVRSQTGVLQSRVLGLSSGDQVSGTKPASVLQ